MSSKRDLVARWENEPGLSIVMRLYEFAKSAHGENREDSTNEMLRILEGVPYREEVQNGRDLRGAMFGAVRDVDFSGWDFSYAKHLYNMYNCDFSNARFDGAKISGSLSGQLQGASFRGAKMRKLFLMQSKLLGCCFDNASLVYASFEESDLTGSSFQKADLCRAQFLRATIIGCDFRGAKLDEAMFREVRLDKSTDLRGASLINLVFDEHRSYAGALVARGTDWRQATYDETTKYGDDPVAMKLKTIDSFIRELGLMDEPEALSLKQHFVKLRGSINANNYQTWSEDLWPKLSDAERALFDDVCEEALRNEE